jgi:hypothetical protein
VVKRRIPEQVELTCDRCATTERVDAADETVHRANKGWTVVTISGGRLLSLELCERCSTCLTDWLAIDRPVVLA